MRKKYSKGFNLPAPLVKLLTTFLPKKFISVPSVGKKRIMKLGNLPPKLH